MKSPHIKKPGPETARAANQKAMQPAFFQQSTPLKKQYTELQYLARFYRWSIKFGATGARSPTDGNQYRTSATQAHHQAHAAASKAMAKSYMQAAIETRLKIESQIAHQ